MRCQYNKIHATSVDNVDSVDNLDSVDNVGSVDNVDSVDSVDNVDNVAVMQTWWYGVTLLNGIKYSCLVHSKSCAFFS